MGARARRSSPLHRRRQRLRHRRRGGTQRPRSPPWRTGSPPTCWASQPAGRPRAAPPASRCPCPHTPGITRPMTDLEAATLRRVADALIPARGDIPAASAEPGFPERIALALDARSEFESICAALGTLAPAAPDDLFSRLRDLSVTEPESFQALSTVIAGAWLLTSGVGERIGSRGLRSERPDSTRRSRTSTGCSIRSSNALRSPRPAGSAYPQGACMTTVRGVLSNPLLNRAAVPSGRLRPAVPRVAARICHNPAGLRPAARPPPGRGRRARQGRVTAAGCLRSRSWAHRGRPSCAGGQGGDSGQEVEAWTGCASSWTAAASYSWRRRTATTAGPSPGMAALLGLKAHILVPRDMAAARVDALRAEGAHVTVVDGTYDEAVTWSAALAGDRHVVVSDTSWDGYVAVPGWVIDGYATIVAETLSVLAGSGNPPPTLVAVQIGGCAFAAAMVRGFVPAGRAGRRRGAGAGGLPAGERARRAAGAAQRCPGFDHGQPDSGTPAPRIAWPVLRAEHREVRRGIG